MEKLVHKTWLLDGFFHSAPGFITIENDTFIFVYKNYICQLVVKTLNDFKKLIKD